MKIPKNFKKEYTLRELSCWFKENYPLSLIEMTIDQEMWYRELLPPEYQIPRSVTFRGVIIKIYYD